MSLWKRARRPNIGARNRELVRVGDPSGVCQTLVKRQKNDAADAEAIAEAAGRRRCALLSQTPGSSLRYGFERGSLCPPAHQLINALVAPREHGVIAPQGVGA